MDRALDLQNKTLHLHHAFWHPHIYFAVVARPRLEHKSRQRFWQGNVQKRVCCTCRVSERLPFVWKTWEFRGEFKWNGSSRWKFSGKKSNTFRGITFFPFLPKQPTFSVPFVWITSARLHCREKVKNLPVFCKWYTSIPFLFSLPKKIPVPFAENFHRNFGTYGKRSLFCLLNPLFS